MKLRSVRLAKVRGRRVLVTAELNVARNAAGKIVDDSRLKAVLPTLQLLHRAGAKVIIATHLGRPKGQIVPSLSTHQLVQPLAVALKMKVAWMKHSVGADVVVASKTLANGALLLLENTRFNVGDEANSPLYSRQLAANADIFVLESFGTAHRRHASIVGVGRYLPSYAGLAFIHEVQELSAILKYPRRPLVAILGGAKISTKIGLIARLLPHVDSLLLGGALANTILQAKGLQIARSLTEKTMVKKVKALKLTDAKLHIPVDVVVRSSAGRIAVRAVGAVRPNESILDIGPDTVALFASIVKAARMIVWNGPMGRLERKPFDRGTMAIAAALARTRAYTVVGGGETVQAIDAAHVQKRMNFISTGGGAMMEFLEGKHLPGVELVRI